MVSLSLILGSLWENSICLTGSLLCSKVIDTRPNEQDTDNKKENEKQEAVQIEVLLHAENVCIWRELDPVKDWS